MQSPNKTIIPPSNRSINVPLRPIISFLENPTLWENCTDWKKKTNKSKAKGINQNLFRDMIFS